MTADAKRHTDLLFSGRAYGYVNARGFVHANSALTSFMRLGKSSASVIQTLVCATILNDVHLKHAI